MSPQTRDRWVGFWLALLLGCVYLLTHSWMYHSVDEMSVVAAAKTVLAGDGWHANQMEWEQSWRKSQTMTGLDGNLYLNKRGLAVVALIMPWLAAGGLVKAVGAVQLALLVGPLVTALYRGRAVLHGAAAGVRRRRRGAGCVSVGAGDLGVALLAHGLHRAHRGVGIERGAVRRGHVPARGRRGRDARTDPGGLRPGAPDAGQAGECCGRIAVRSLSGLRRFCRTPRGADPGAGREMAPGVRPPARRRRGGHRGLQLQRFSHPAHAPARLSGRFQDADHHGPARAAVQLGQGRAVARAPHLAGDRQRVLLAAEQTAAGLPAGVRHSAFPLVAVQRVVRLGRWTIVGAAFPGNRHARGGADGFARAGRIGFAHVAAAGAVGGRGSAVAHGRDAIARRPDQLYGAGGAGHRRRSVDPAALLDATAFTAGHVLARHRLGNDRPTAGAARALGPAPGAYGGTCRARPARRRSGRRWAVAFAAWTENGRVGRGLPGRGRCADRGPVVGRCG